MRSFYLYLIAYILCLFVKKAYNLQCYQCDSDEDEDCPAFGYFDEYKNALVDCYGLESATPGHMCVKITKSSPDTLYGKGWKKTVRRCASRSDFSVSWGCRYYIDEVGLYVETCYCSDREGCNSSPRLLAFNSLVILILLVLFQFSFHSLLF